MSVSHSQLSFAWLLQGMRDHPIIELLAWEFIAFLPMILSSFISSNEDMQYMALNKPAFAPPAWAFIVVWILNFSLSGVGAWLVSPSSASWEQKGLGVLSVRRTHSSQSDLINDTPQP